VLGCGKEGTASALDHVDRAPFLHPKDAEQTREVGSGEGGVRQKDVGQIADKGLVVIHNVEYNYNC
jgi:hypothetical protein